MPSILRYSHESIDTRTGARAYARARSLASSKRELHSEKRVAVAALQCGWAQSFVVVRVIPGTTSAENAISCD